MGTHGPGIQLALRNAAVSRWHATARIAVTRSPYAMLRMAPVQVLTSAPAACALTTPLTERVTVNVWGLEDPVMPVTVIRSPPILMSKGNAMRLSPVTPQRGEPEVVVATDRDVRVPSSVAVT